VSRFGDPVAFPRIDHVLHRNLAIRKRPVDFAVVVDVERAYLQQSRRVDIGDARAWRNACCTPPVFPHGVPPKYVNSVLRGPSDCP